MTEKAEKPPFLLSWRSSIFPAARLKTISYRPYIKPKPRHKVYMIISLAAGNTPPRK